MKTRALHLIAILGLLLAGSLQAQESTLAPTPPMGWNSWNKFACNVSEDMMDAECNGRRLQLEWTSGGP